MGFFAERAKGVEELRPLKQALLDAYGHFADERFKKIDSSNRFIIDNRGPSDYGADRKLFLWFCAIFVEVTGPASIKVTLRGGVPQSLAVTEWAKKYQASTSENTLSFDVTPDDLRKLPALAKAFRAIVTPGARYSVKSYKYVCPRTASSLDNLHAVLVDHWQQN